MKFFGSSIRKFLGIGVGIMAVLFSVSPALAADHISYPVVSDQDELADFVDTVYNGKSSQVVGIYIEDKLAMPVVQQPNGDHAFISSLDNTLTQFGLPGDYGVLGILAHNTEAGADFYDLALGDEVVVVYGNGATDRYEISNDEVWQAFNPQDPYDGSFQSLDTNRTLSLRELFIETYTTPETLVFQTCYAQGDNLQWGRLFVTATLID